MDSYCNNTIHNFYLLGKDQKLENKKSLFEQIKNKEMDNLP